MLTLLRLFALRFCSFVLFSSVDSWLILAKLVSVFVFAVVAGAVVSFRFFEDACRQEVSNRGADGIVRRCEVTRRDSMALLQRQLAAVYPSPLLSSG